jgi:N-acetylglucosamine kinase-like BadF-type ATPase
VKRPAVLAVDGGGSKVDAVLLARDGSVLATARSRNDRHGGSHGPGYLEAVQAAVSAAARTARLDPERGPIAGLGVYCLAGADLPADDRRLLRWFGGTGWTRELLLRNDTFAVLRAGTDRPWGVAVVCGYGTNCAAVAPDGRSFRFPAVGTISGDWGGGMDIGGAALWHAIRAEDGRGQSTLLARLVPEHFGLRRPRQVMEAMHLGRIPEERVAELPPVVFHAASLGDPVARRIVDRQADEVVTMAGAAMRRLRMTDLDVDVVLGGGIFRNGDRAFFERIGEGFRRVAPRAKITVLRSPPVVGAALLGLDHIGGSRAARARARRVIERRLGRATPSGSR